MGSVQNLLGAFVLIVGTGMAYFFNIFFANNNIPFLQVTDSRPGHVSWINPLNARQF